MVASSFQGFNKKLNLIETEVDRDFLNNLGGAPIADDIGLFTNNLRNVSTQTVDISQISGDTITFPITVPFVYTDGTKVNIGGTSYTITDNNKNENDEITIRLLDSANNIVTSPPTGDYQRSDAITSENINNMVRYRDVVVETPSASLVFSDDENINGNTTNIYQSFTKLFSEYSGFPNNISVYLNDIETNKSIVDFKKSNSIIKNTNFTTSYGSEFDGVAIVKDQDGLNDIILDNQNPGLFILNTITDEYERAYSSNDNVWSEAVNDLVVDTREIVVENLVYNTEIKLTTNGSPITELDSGDVNADFTHFTKIKVNGEDFYLCMKPDI